MKFILIILIMHGGSGGAAMQEFNNIGSCEAALVKLTQHLNATQNRTSKYIPKTYTNAPDVHGVCVKKG